MLCEPMPGEIKRWVSRYSPKSRINNTRQANRLPCIVLSKHRSLFVFAFTFSVAAFMVVIVLIITLTRIGLLILCSEQQGFS